VLARLADSRGRPSPCRFLCIFVLAGECIEEWNGAARRWAICYTVCMSAEGGEKPLRSNDKMSRREFLKFAGASALTLSITNDTMNHEGLPGSQIKKLETNIAERESGPHLLNMFPWGDAGLDEYAKARTDAPEKVALMKEVMYTFLDQEIQNTRIYESRGASFPYTVIRIKDLARALYNAERTSVAEPTNEVGRASSAEAVPSTKHVEFVMTSVLATVHGHPFTFCEEAIHQTMRALPAALTALENGEESEDIEIYTLGFPTNELGTMDAPFTDAMVESPFKTLGSLYGESVEKLALESKKQNQKMELVFTGVSMGANFAAEAATALLDKGLVTQSREDASIEQPHLTLNLYTPAGLNEAALRKLQISLGFVAEGVFQLAANPVVRKIAPNEGKFLEGLKTVLKKEGIEAHMDEAQTERKNKVTSMMGSIVQKLIQGVPIDPNLVANKLVGTVDPTLYSMERNRKLTKQKEEHPNSLGSHTIRESHPNQRTFGVQMSHTIPFFRASEFKRWDKVVGKVN